MDRGLVAQREDWLIIGVVGRSACGDNRRLGETLTKIELTITSKLIAIFKRSLKLMIRPINNLTLLIEFNIDLRLAVRSGRWLRARSIARKRAVQRNRANDRRFQSETGFPPRKPPSGDAGPPIGSNFARASRQLGNLFGAPRYARAQHARPARAAVHRTVAASATEGSSISAGRTAIWPGTSCHIARHDDRRCRPGSA